MRGRSVKRGSRRSYASQRQEERRREELFDTPDVDQVDSTTISTPPTCSSHQSDEVGASALQDITRLMSTEIAPGLSLDSFLDGDLYGNVLRIDNKYLTKKRGVVSGSMCTISSEIQSLLSLAPKSDLCTGTFSLTSRYASTIDGWRVYISKNPHLWPTGDVYLYLLELDGSLSLVDNATNKSLSERTDAKFKSGNGDAHRGMFLPCTPSSSAYSFPQSTWLDAFPHLCNLRAATKKAINEISTPAYAWPIVLRSNINRTIEKSGVHIDRLGNIIYSYLRDEISNYYLGKLGVISFKFTPMRLLQSIGMRTDKDTAIASIDQILKRSDMASRIFKESTLTDFTAIRENLMKSSDGAKIGTVQKSSQQSPCESPAPDVDLRESIPDELSGSTERSTPISHSQARDASGENEGDEFIENIPIRTTQSSSFNSTS